MRADEETILAAITELEEQEVKRALIEVLVLVAITDGDLHKQEREFLSKVADQLDISTDLDEVEARAEEFRVEIKKDVLQRAVDKAGSMAGKATGVGLAAAGVTAEALGKTGRVAGEVVGDTAGKVGEVAAVAGGKAKATVGRIFSGRKKKDTLACPDCGETAPPNFRFCPACRPIRSGPGRRALYPFPSVPI